MLNIDFLLKVKHIVTHKNCSDGTASAMILKQIYPEAKVTFVQHNTEEHKNLIAEPNMLFCDFAPTEDRVLDFVKANSLILDHHKYSKHIVEKFASNGVFADEQEHPGVSGAVLAFNEVWLPLFEQAGHTLQSNYIVEEFAKLIGIRDTWQNKSEKWQQACEVSAGLFFYSVEDVLKLKPNQWFSKFAIGKEILKKQLLSANRAIESSHTFTTKNGLRVIMFEGLTLSSDVAEMLDRSVDLVVGFGYRSENNCNKLIFSTRSHTDFNCGEFCKSFGGGGHTKAAGFDKLIIETDLNPYSFFKEIINNYEKK